MNHRVLQWHPAFKEVSTVCEALKELFAEELEEKGKQALKQGLERGKADSIIDLLSELGTVPDTVLDLVYSQKDLKILTSWLKLAAKSNSIEAFQKSIKN